MSNFEDAMFQKQMNRTRHNKNHKGAIGNDNSTSDNSDRFVFFWRDQSPYSQWYACKFVVDGNEYNCAEQYMMHQKAVLFGDTEIANAILRARTPKEHKSLGRQVANFNDKIWNKNCQDIVYKGSLAKFTQNEKLYDALMHEKHRGKEFVEASPVDAIWGIGLDESKARHMNPSQWRGKNLLGKILTRVRDDILEQNLTPQTK
jgi:ribA/ribD-fused uncharacterized protein